MGPADESAAADAIVKLYARPGCHLCDEARRELEAMRTAGARFDLIEVDIEDDDELLRAYLERIPVIAVGDEVVSELELDAPALEARLATVQQ
ncbi:MAG TPA: glutaredoxin family protein [Solirubrobacterales bacterium]|jgi:glutaredoxin|nr:glutaredoxin family protein [Solirubrobacterales bacterium]